MAINDILVFLSAGEVCDARLSLAIALAERHGAALSGLCVLAEPEIEMADGWAIGPRGVGEVLAHREAAMERTLAPIMTAFQAACSARGAICRWLLPNPGAGLEDLALAARCFDLAIVGRPMSRNGRELRLAELVALTSGTPCLLAAERFPVPSIFDRVLIAWNGSGQARHALGEGMMFLEQAKTVRLVTIGCDPGQAGIDDILRHLAAHGVDAGFERVTNRKDAGEALLERCVKFGADLMIMGAYAHAPASEMILGGATRTVLREARIPVLMAH